MRFGGWSRGAEIAPKKELVKAEQVEAEAQRRILTIRGQQVVLDSDLAEFYGVETRILTRAVRRNVDRFPEDFMFQLSKEEYDALRSQIGISKEGRGGRRYRPYAFTEQGALQAAGVLRSERAAEVSVAVARAFVAMREQIATLEERSSGAGELAQAVTQLKRDVEGLKADAKKHSDFEQLVTKALADMKPLLRAIEEAEEGRKRRQLPAGRRKKK